MKLEVYFEPLFSVYCPLTKNGQREILHQSRFGVLVWEQRDGFSPPFNMCMRHEPEDTVRLARVIANLPAPAGESEGAQ